MLEFFESTAKPFKSILKLFLFKGIIPLFFIGPPEMRLNKY
jgi:hypothetical protein